MSASSRPEHLSWSRPIRFGFWPLAVGWTLVIGGVALYLGTGSAPLRTRLTIGNSGIAAACLFGLVACARAAAHRTPARRGWFWMAVAMGFALLGQILFLDAVVRERPRVVSALSDTLNYLGYAVPSILSLFAFPRPRERLISRFRNVLDAIVIAIGVLLVINATVGSALRSSTGALAVYGASGLAYPVADTAICAVVLTLGMRQRPEHRVTWLLFGAGLVTLAFTDSVYVRSVALGKTDVTGGPAVVGWMVAAVLIGLATLVPESTGQRHVDLDLFVQLVPYAPVLAAILLAPLTSPDDPLVVMVYVMLATVSVRQVMIVYENLSLTRDLEAKVAERTAELATLGSIVTSSRDAIVGVSMSNEVTAWNPAAEQLYGYRQEDVLGRAPHFVGPEGLGWIAMLLGAAARREPLDVYQVVWPRPDGTTVPVAMTVSPVVDGDVVKGISVSGQDITERLRAAEVLEQAREDALASSRMKSEFLATMSHEIRTPMNGVIGLTSLLIETDLDPQQRGYAEGVHSAGQSLLDVINDILDFSKLEAGKVVIESDDFDLRRLVEDVGNLLAPAAFAKGLELLVDYPPSAPTVVRGDHVRVRQILLNLASNAVKFTAVGEVEIRVGARSAGEGRVALHFEVLDTGIGISESDQGRLFESFSQADASTTRRFGGTGLGLAICRRLVEVMDGAIGLTSAPGRGSTFWFDLELPLGQPLPDPVVAALPRLPADLRVLVVDDNASNRTILEAQLQAWGMTVDLTDNAVSALALLRTAKHHERAYDLAVLDLLMPEVDGLQLARAISADPELAGLPMLMLTSAARLPTALFREAGIGRWLTKPATSSDLYERLVRLLVRTEIPRPPSTPARPASPARRGRVLVVEDNAINQLVAAGLVARLGFEIETAANGREALDALEQGAFDAVLMDCHMPVMDGFKATEEIRRREKRRRRTPIIALTAGALVSDRERCLAAGMDDYLAKPIDAEALTATLDRWVPADDADPFAATDGAEPDAPAPAEVPAVAEEPAIDSQRFESLGSLRSADGTRLVTTFVRTFTDRSGNRSAAIRQAAAAQDDDALAEAAHELKGSAATIGAVRVATLCDALEHGRTEVVRDRPDLLDELESELGRANRALSELVAALT